MRSARAVLSAAVLYFVLVFAAGMALGPVRVLALEPRIGPAFAVALEAPFLIAAMWFAARAAPIWAGLRGGLLNGLSVGVLALVLQQGADLAVGLILRGMTLAQQMAQFSTPAGAIYAATLILFAAMPAFRMRGAGPGDGAAP